MAPFPTPLEFANQQPSFYRQIVTMRKKRYLSLLRRSLLITVLLWAIALILLSPIVSIPAPISAYVRLLLAVITVILIITCARRGSRRNMYAATYLFAGVLTAAHCGLRPRADRSWVASQVNAGWGSIADNQVVTLHNVRRFRYQSAGIAAAEQWGTEKVDTANLIGADFILTRFGSMTAPGHVMVSFAFTSKLNPTAIKRIVISAEIRKEIGEAFSAIKGMFRNYEIIYVFGDELDLIKLRTNIHKDKTYLFPIHADIKQIRAYFLRMVERAGRLRAQPEFYHTLLNSCSTSLAKHLADVSAHKLARHIRVMLPGHSPKLLSKLGLTDFDAAKEGTEENDKTYDEWEAAHLINPNGELNVADDLFSNTIRQRSDTNEQ